MKGGSLKIPLSPCWFCIRCHFPISSLFRLGKARWYCVTKGLSFLCADLMMMTAVFPYCPNQERHLRQILKIMVYIGIISRSPCHTCIIFQTKFQIFAFFLVHFAWFSFHFFSSGFSLIVSFVFKPPLISKYFAYYLQLIGKKMLRKKLTTSLSFGDSVHVQMFQYCLLMTFSHLPVLIM